MYKISKFFENLLKTVFRIAIILFLLMTLYMAFNFTVGGDETPESIEFKVVEKFEEDKGFVLFDKNIKTSGKQKKVRVDYITMNELETNVLNVSQSEFNRLEKGKSYIGRFQGGDFKYIQFNKDLKDNKKDEEKKKDDKEKSENNE